MVVLRLCLQKNIIHEMSICQVAIEIFCVHALLKKRIIENFLYVFLSDTYTILVPVSNARISD